VAKENKNLLERGERIRAGLIISKYLRAILQEKTELVSVAVGPDEVKQKLVTKGEKIARDMVREAMESDDSKTKLEYRKLVIERADGKAGTVQEALGDDEKSIPDRMSEENKARLNRIADEAMGEDNE
jgi:hypothetical protein